MTGTARTPALPPFDRVVDEHGPAVLRFCVSRVGPELAEDCFQLTMLEALRAYGDLRDRRALRGWLFTIASRTATDLYRERQRQPVPVEDVAAHAGGVEHERPDDELWGRVAGLPDKQRQAVALRFIADLSHRAIGEAMDTSEAAARRNLHEALRSLREGARI